MTSLHLFEKASDVVQVFRRWCVPLSLCSYILANKMGFFTSATFVGCHCNSTIVSGSIGISSTASAFFQEGLFMGSQLIADLPQLYFGATDSFSSMHSSVDFDDLSSLARVQDHRRLSTNSSSTSGSSSSGHSSHPHEAMFFLVISLAVGTFVTQLVHLPILQGLQQTVVVFVIGCVLSLIIETSEIAGDLGVVGRSYLMWMEIDPHLLLFTMLPALLTGDAMAIDTSVAKRVMKQCLFLAGPGVLIAGMLTALFLWIYLPYDWDFMLCLTAGAILCATDPVAVVALLKELGASPTLTVQIQGESLLNDGTAIVLYTISYDMLSGKKYDAGDIIEILVKMAIYAWGLGMIIGFVFFKWIKLANNKLDHNSSIIQIALTISCAYLSFVLAEGWLHLSGVLCTVASALVLAHKMWPEVADKHTMHTVWHMLEYLFNSIIFFLAGTLTGKAMTAVDFVDYAHLLVIYIMITIIRGAMVLCSRPLLTLLHEDRAKVSVADALVMTWGGLRGAIGLALAIQVQIGQADGNIAPKDATRVQFYVSGVAALTLIINATTCPALVNWLGITQMAESKKKLLLAVNQQLMHLTELRTKPGKVRDAILDIINEVEHEIMHPRSKYAHMKEMIDDYMPAEHLDHHNPLGLAKHGRQSVAAGLALEQTNISGVRVAKALRQSENHARQDGLIRRLVVEEDAEVHQSTQELVADFNATKEKYNPKQLRRLKVSNKAGDVTDVPFEEEETDFILLIENEDCDMALLRSVNEAFLNIVHSSYWEMIEHNDFYGDEASIVLSSITMALSLNTYDLSDFKFIEPFVKESFETSGGRHSTIAAQVLNKNGVTSSGPLHDFLNSSRFLLVLAIVIISNAIVTAAEQQVADEHEKLLGWLIIEILFTVLFSIEFCLKFADLKFRYFFDSWNVFDFCLVVFGIVGSVFSIMVYSLPQSGDSNGVPASEARLIKIAQIFKMMRLLRLVRLSRFFTTVKAYLTNTHISMEVAEHMMKQTVLSGFIRAHLNAQKKLVDYFGLKGKVDTPEVARCMLQSKVFVYRAISLMVLEEMRLSKELLEEVGIAEECRAAAEECAKFINGARYGGVLTNVEAESMLHPLYDSIAKFIQDVKDAHKGRVDERLSLHGGVRERLTTSVDSDNETVSPLSTPKAPPVSPASPVKTKIRRVRSQSSPKGKKAGAVTRDLEKEPSRGALEERTGDDVLPSKLGREDTSESTDSVATRKSFKRRFKTKKNAHPSNVTTDGESGTSAEPLDKTPLLVTHAMSESSVRPTNKKRWIKAHKSLSSPQSRVVKDESGES